MRSVREVRATQPQLESYDAYADRGAMRLLSADKALPIRAGEEELAVTVQVVWEFE